MLTLLVSLVKGPPLAAEELHALEVGISFRSRRQASQGRYTPNLWPVWVVAPIALIVTGVVGWLIYEYAYDHFTEAAARQRPPKPADINDVLKATVTGLTLIGAVLAGLYAYRKQLLTEGDAHRADASQLADRYTTAAEQLGHEQAAVRLAGVYAMASLADDWSEQRQVCIDVLCAYLRMPYASEASDPLHRSGEQEVRQTIIRVIRGHLQDPDLPSAWCSYDFNFAGAVFDGGSLSTSHFQGVTSFFGSTFIGGSFSFRGATFAGTVNFGRVTFDGGKVNFANGRFTDGTVSFIRTRFLSGTVGFRTARFEGAVVDFGRVTFEGGGVDFSGAAFSAGAVDFRNAEFRAGTIDLHGARFDGAAVFFSRATFTGSSVSFLGAAISGSTVYFHDAAFTGGEVTFADVGYFRGDVLFNSASFGGTLIDWGPLLPPANA
ncbi:pentapeptide repeat-containing protein [Streptomyces sp. NPDC048508]|uniref:pentapeptide repeat-containing protein n=1 Tax=Streptomyces sp. NPDC048508 TaxID=3365561 RepID=UPI003712C023